MHLRIFGREPVVISNFIAAVLGLVVSLGFTPLTAEMAGAIVALISAVFGGIAAALTRPIAPQAFTAVVAAGATLLATFGYHVAQGTIGAVNVVVLAGLTLLTRGQVAPARGGSTSGPRSA